MATGKPVPHVVINFPDLSYTMMLFLVSSVIIIRRLWNHHHLVAILHGRFGAVQVAPSDMSAIPKISMPYEVVIEGWSGF